MSVLPYGIISLGSSLSLDNLNSTVQSGLLEGNDKEK